MTETYEHNGKTVVLGSEEDIRIKTAELGWPRDVVLEMAGFARGDYHGDVIEASAETEKKSHNDGA